jgi:DNA ligase-1
MKFENLFNDLRNTSKPAEKQKVLISYDSPELRELLRLTYDNFILFNVNIKPKDMPEPADKDLSDLFEQVESVLRFCENSNSAKQNREMVISLLKQLNFGSQELLVGVINKNWAVGVSSKAVLKWLPGLINQFNVQLSNTYDPNSPKHQLENWLLSYKLDGLRCIALRKEDIWTLYSRKGKEFLTVDHLKPQLEKIYEKYGYTFFDGELYKHGLTFEEVQGPVMAFTKGQVPDMEYHLFVAGDAKKFLSGEDPNHVKVIDNISEPVTHIIGTSLGLIQLNEIVDKVEESFEQGYEGIMLRDPHNLYDYKRSNALLKLKRSLVEEVSEQSETISDCVVTRIEYKDAFPYIENGKLYTERLLNKIWVLQKNGIEGKVGSGYSLDFRRKYTDSPWELIGMPVEIKHQGWGANGRMRFARLWRIRKDL